MFYSNHSIYLFFFFLFHVERSFHVGKYLELEFDFRTSEMNGVLISVSEPNGFPALSIELYNGKVSLRKQLKP